MQSDGWPGKFSQLAPLHHTHNAWTKRTMTDPNLPTRSISSKEREAAVDRLCAHFAQDNLAESELERRLDLAYGAKTRADLMVLERDLPELGQIPESTAVAPLTSAASVSSAPAALVDPNRVVRDREFMVSIMGGQERKGSWTPARTIRTLTVMGSGGLDFRDALFATNEVTVHLVAVMGGVEIIVPPGVRVEWDGIAIMGGVDVADPVQPPGPDAPVIRITGLVCMAGLDVVERERGETAREARKRRRALKKARRKLRPGIEDPGA